MGLDHAKIADQASKVLRIVLATPRDRDAIGHQFLLDRVCPHIRRNLLASGFRKTIHDAAGDEMTQLMHKEEAVEHVLEERFAGGLVFGIARPLVPDVLHGRRKSGEVSLVRPVTVGERDGRSRVEGDGIEGKRSITGNPDLRYYVRSETAHLNHVRVAVLGSGEDLL